MPISEVVRERLDPDQRYGLRLTLFAVAFMLVAVPFGLLLREVTLQGPLTRIDTVAAVELHERVRESPLLVTGLRVVTSLGSPVWFYVLVGGASIFLWKRGHPRLALFLVVTSVLGGALNTGIKEIVERPRPSLTAPVATARGKSFPSGHAMGSTIVYGALLLAFLRELPRRTRGPAVVGTALLVLAIGATRLALGVHYITDVVGGYVLGLAWLSVSAAAFSIWKMERRRSEGTDVSRSDPL